MNTVTELSKSIFVAVLLIISVSTVFSNPVSSAHTAALQSLEVRNQAEQVTLVWQFEEGTVSNIYVQRAGTDMHFETISDLDSVNIDQFTDEQPQTGFSFYRLVTQYADGTIIYHKTVAISR